MVSRSRRALATAVAVCLVTIGCGSSAEPSPSGTATTNGPRHFPLGAWTWVDVPGTACSDGSTTGFAINPAEGTDVAFFLDGGGACWDYTTCFVLKSASAGPVQALQFAVRSLGFAGTFLDRTAAGNPFRTWTYVYVPYCTGDLHSGDREATYSLPAGPSAKWFHRGRANIAADLQVVVPELPRPRRLVVGGSSAGGFGSLLQYDAIRKAFAADATFLLDDSGPPLEGDALNPTLRGEWRSSWNLDPLLAEVCPDCADDFSRIIPQLVTRYPADRIALLSSLQDSVIRTYFLLPAIAFEAALLLTIHDRFDPRPSARTFVVGGEDHALLAKAASYSAGGVTLPAWLSQMVEGDPAWRSVGP